MFYMVLSMSLSIVVFLIISLRRICEYMSFLQPVFSHVRTESSILSLYEKMRVRENLYSGIFYAVYVSVMCIIFLHTITKQVIKKKTSQESKSMIRKSLFMYEIQFGLNKL